MTFELPEAWIQKPLKALVTFRGGGAFSRDLQGQTAGEYPFIKVSDMSKPQNERYITVASNWVDDEIAAALKSKPMPARSVVFAKIGEGLKANRMRVLTRPTYIDNNMMAAIPNSAVVDPTFLYYLLIETKLFRYAGGSALPFLRQSDLNEIEVAVPPMDEQHRIAAVLEAVDAKITANNKLQDRLVRLSDSLFTRVCESAKLAGIEAVPASELIQVNPKVPITKGTVTPFLEMAATDPWALRPVSMGERPFSGGCKFEPHDTLLAKITGCIEHGKGAFADFVEGPAAGSTEFLVLRAGELLTPEAVFLISRWAAVRSHLIKRMVGSSGRQRVPTDAFESLSLFVPAKRSSWDDEAEVLRQSFRRAHTAWVEQRRLCGIRDALLPRLISGRLRVAENYLAESVAV
jgi:hypothetical protein